MRKSAKAWLITALILVILGAFLFTGALFSVQWDFSKISTGQYLTKSYEISEDFNNISIDTDTSDIKFELSQDGRCRVVCFEEKNTYHRVFAEDDTLVVNRETEKAWYDYISINSNSPKITVYLPKAEFDSVSVKVRTGDIAFKNLCVKNLDLTLSTGDVFISDIRCENLVSKASTGDVELQNIISTGKMDIKRSSGDVEFIGCDAPQLYINTNTGDVEGSLLSPKTFITKTSTGKICVPKNSDGGMCEISTTTGDIEIEIDYKF